MVPLSCIRARDAVELIGDMAEQRGGGFVVTPNVDHVVIAEHHAEFRAAYEAASLSLVDGMPVLWGARLLGHPVPEKVSGSDLLWPLLEMAARRGLSVYLLGGAEGAAEEARSRLSVALPALKVVGIDCPRIDLARPDADELVLARIGGARPHLLIVGLGAPKQELWMYRNQHRLGGTVALGLGASIDFLAGKVKRAPRWMSSSGLEWLYRLVQEPKRLARRYLLRDPEFLWILLRELLGSRATLRASARAGSRAE